MTDLIILFIHWKAFKGHSIDPIPWLIQSSEMDPQNYIDNNNLRLDSNFKIKMFNPDKLHIEKPLYKILSILIYNLLEYLI